MKTRHIYVLILMIFAIYQSVAQNVNFTPTAPTNKVKYTPDNFPEFTQRAPLVSSYRYFWNFGDGHFKLLDVENTNTSSDVKKSFNYTYDQPTPASFKTQLQITQIYSPPTKPDDELKVGDSPTVPLLGGTLIPTGNNVDMLGGSLIIHPVREIRPGYLMTFIVTYDIGRMGCNMGAGLTDWRFVFTYNSNILEPPIGYPILEGYNGETLTSHTLGGPMDEVIVDITRPGTWVPGPDERYSFFLHFKVSDGAPIAAPILAKGTFGEFDRNNMQLFPCDSFFLPDMQVVKSYDPNYKLVSKDTITTNPSQLLHYTIHFQNTGKGPTSTIRIEDMLDPRLDPSTLVVTSARIGYQHIPSSSLTSPPVSLDSSPYPWITSNPTPKFDLTESKPGPAEYEWLFNNAVLRGTKEANYGDDFSEIETTGSIEFDIMTCGFMEYGIVIENEAEIYFDANDSIVTEPAQTFKYCCELVADTLGKDFNLGDFFNKNMFPNLISFSLTSDTAGANRRPKVNVNTASFNTLYQPVPGGYSGLDIMTIIVCDGNTPPHCDTVEIRICANVDHGPNKYPCDTTQVNDTCSMSGVYIDPDKVSPLDKVKVFPNPAKDILIVEYKEAFLKVQHLSLYNLQGQKVRDISPDLSGRSEISLSGLPAGLYLLRVNERWSKKIIKQ